MIGEIKRFLSGDEYLANLIEQIKEQAQLYLLAKQRQKGCDEMGWGET